MSLECAFQPKQGGNQRVTATTTSQNITIGAGQRSLRAMNAGAQVVYFRTYKAIEGAQTATNTDTPLATAGAAGSVLIVEKPVDHDTVAYLADSATAVVHFQPGEGGG